MDGSSLLSSLSSPSSLQLIPTLSPNSISASFHYSSSSVLILQFLSKPKVPPPKTVHQRSLLGPLRSSAFALKEALSKPNGSLSTISAREMLPSIDKSGSFCSPRVARELAL